MTNLCSHHRQQLQGSCQFCGLRNLEQDVGKRASLTS